MKKIINLMLVSLIACIVFSAVAVSISATQSESLDVTFFDMDGDYIRQNPFGGQNVDESWLLMGKNVITNGDDKTYPISISNTFATDSFYYVAGSNNLKEISLEPELISFLENDFVIEYELKYDLNSNGHISVVAAYNYNGYYVDAYISSDGTGDIALVERGVATSMLDENSVIDPENPNALLEKLYGAISGKSTRFADSIMVSVRISVNEYKMPKKIYMYVNGCLVAQTAADFEEKVALLTPEYEISADNDFPADKLGNIIAIKSSSGSACKINSVKAYPVDNENYTPNGVCAKYYRDVYGNISYNPSDYSKIEEDTTDGITSDSDDVTGEIDTGDVENQETTDNSSIVETEEMSDQNITEEQTTKKHRDDRYDDPEEPPLDVISTLCVIFAGISGAIVIIALVILKTRVKNK